MSHTKNTESRVETRSRTTGARGPSGAFGALGTAGFLGLMGLAGGLGAGCTRASSPEAGPRGTVPVRVNLPRPEAAAAARAARAFALQTGAKMTYHPWHVALRVTGPGGFVHQVAMKPGQGDFTLEVPLGSVKVEALVLGYPLEVGTTIAQSCARDQRLALKGGARGKSADAETAALPSGGPATGDGGSDGGSRDEGGDRGVFISTAIASYNVTSATAELPVTFSPLKYAGMEAFGLRLLDGQDPAAGSTVRYLDAFSGKPVSDPCTGEPLSVTADAKGRVAGSLPHAEGYKNAFALGLARGQPVTLPLDTSAALGNFFDVNLSSGALSPMPSSFDFFGVGASLGELLARKAELPRLLDQAESLLEENIPFEGNLWMPGLPLPAVRAFIDSPSNGVVGPLTRLDCYQKQVDRDAVDGDLRQQAEWIHGGKVLNPTSGGGSFYVPKGLMAGDTLSCRVRVGLDEGSGLKWGLFGEPARLTLTTSEIQPAVAPDWFMRQDPLAAQVAAITEGGLRVSWTPSSATAQHGGQYRVVWAEGQAPASCEGTSGISRYRNAADTQAIDIPGSSLGNKLGAAFGVRVCAHFNDPDSGMEFLTAGRTATGSTATNTTQGLPPLPDSMAPSGTGTGGQTGGMGGITAERALARRGGTIDLAWDAPANFTRFKVEVADSWPANWTPLGEPAARSFSTGVLSPGKQYTFRITPFDSSGTAGALGEIQACASTFIPMPTLGEESPVLPAGAFVHDFTILPLSGGPILVAAMDSGVAISRDGGTSWRLASTAAGLLESLTRRIHVGTKVLPGNPSGSAVLCAAHDSGFSLSHDMGQTWHAERLKHLTDTTTMTTPLAQNVEARTCAVSGPRTFIGTSHGLVTIDDSANSRTVRIDTTFGSISDLESRGGAITFSTAASGIHYSDDNGTSWSTVPGTTGVAWSRVSRKGGDIATVSGSSVYLGTHSGISTTATSFSASGASDVAIDGSGRVYVAHTTGISEASSVGGTFTKLSGTAGVPTQSAKSLSTAGDAVAVAMERTVLWRAGPGDFSSRSNATSTEGLGKNLRGVVEFAGALYALSGNEGVARSTDGGKTWTKVSMIGVPAGASTYSRIIATPDRIWIVTNAGVAKATATSLASSAVWTADAIDTFTVSDLAWDGATLVAFVPTHTARLFTYDPSIDDWHALSGAGSCLGSFASGKISSGTQRVYVWNSTAGLKWFQPGATPTCDAISLPSGVTSWDVRGVAEHTSSRVYVATAAVSPSNLPSRLYVWDGGAGNLPTPVIHTAFPVATGITDVKVRDGKVVALLLNGDLLWSTDASNWRAYRVYDGLPSPPPSNAGSFSLLSTGVIVSQPYGASAIGPVLPSTSAVTLLSAVDASVSLHTALQSHVP